MKYRKLPVEIEAVQFNTAKDIKEFIPENILIYKPSEDYFYIRTLEGDMLISPKDYVIKGIKGEFYPCKPDIFLQTYEQVR